MVGGLFGMVPPHDVWSDGEREIVVPRHNEINEYTAKAILKGGRRRLIMRFAGRVFKSEKRYWAIEVPILTVVSQGRTKKEAFEMIADAIETLVDKPDFKIHLFPGKGEYFEIGASDESALTAFFLRCERAKTGLTLAEVARKMGSKSLNTYARYEQGEPSQQLRTESAAICRRIEEGLRSHRKPGLKQVGRTIKRLLFFNPDRSPQDRPSRSVGPPEPCRSSRTRHSFPR